MGFVFFFSTRHTVDHCVGQSCSHIRTDTGTFQFALNAHSLLFFFFASARIGRPWPPLTWQPLNVEDELEQRKYPSSTQVKKYEYSSLHV